jgi:hypothetical protein
VTWFQYQSCTPARGLLRDGFVANKRALWQLPGYIIMTEDGGDKLRKKIVNGRHEEGTPLRMSYVPHSDMIGTPIIVAGGVATNNAKSHALMRRAGSRYLRIPMTARSALVRLGVRAMLIGLEPRQSLSLISICERNRLFLH